MIYSLRNLKSIKYPSMIIILLLLTFSATTHGSADILRSLSVPQYAFVGGSATLTCVYDLRQTQLYSLKWYHNKTEFYRYVPTERSGPINIKPTPKFVLQEMSRSERSVVLKLSQLTPYASGKYRCEVIAEHPSFRTEALTATMTVLREHLYPPVIVGVKDMYDQDDIIEIGCQPMMPSTNSPRPSIKWYLNGQMVAPKRLSSYSRSQKEDKLGVALRISAEEVLDAGGTSEAECRLILGNHMEKASKLLRVQSHKLYMNTLFSSGSRRNAFESYSPIIAFVILLIM